MSVRHEVSFTLKCFMSSQTTSWKFRMHFDYFRKLRVQLRKFLRIHTTYAGFPVLPQRDARSNDNDAESLRYSFNLMELFRCKVGGLSCES